MPDILEKFTGHLKTTLAKAYALAVELRAPGIHPEHLLLALLSQRGSIAGELLRKSHLSTEELRRGLKEASLIDDGFAREEAGTPDAPKLTAEAKRAVEKAVLTANVHGHKYVGTEHLLAGLLQVGSPVIEAALAEQHVDVERLQNQVATVLKSTGKFPEITETFEEGRSPQKAKEKAVAKEKDKPTKKKAEKTKTPALDFFAVDLTDPTFQAHVDPVIGRDKEIERTVQILCRRTKNNPMLLGEPGVGKTAIVEGLAKKIVEGSVPEVLADKRILSLDLGLMLAGTIYRGEFEGRMKQVIDEVKANADIILFIDEAHTIMGAGATNGSLDAANILKPALARGELRCIGATTLAEYKKHFEGDGALERRFQAVQVNPPSPDDAIKILKGLREHYEEYHGVEIADEAIEAAVQMSERYVTDRFLPDKAIDLIDEAAATLRIAQAGDGEGKRLRSIEDELEGVREKKRKAVGNENFVEALELKAREKELQKQMREATGEKKRKAPTGRIGRPEVAIVVSRATGIPATELLATERDRLLKLESILATRVVGQDDAVRQVAEFVRRAKVGIAHPRRPLASFLFLGTSGVGKTELAKTLAEMVFQDRDAMVRVDMSEFGESFSTAKLVGAPAGYVGYKDSNKFTDAIKRKPHSLVLFDEIEKAHGDVHNLFLQILDDGHLTDATGRKIDFTNAIVVMTSNVGSTEILGRSIGFGDQTEDATTELKAATKANVMQELEKHFRPEFINRVDKVIVFDPLSKADLGKVARLQIDELSGRINKEYGVTVTATPKALELLADKAWNPAYGARGVRRQVQELVENPLARSLLDGTLAEGDVAAVGVAAGEITVGKQSARAKATARA
jgi:ATP-dependent Clp protease ATP-binding subunit ClpC